MKTHKFPKQDTPSLDLVMTDLNDIFGAYSLEVHDLIVKVMQSENIPLEDKITRRMLSNMAIQLAKRLSNYDF